MTTNCTGGSTKEILGQATVSVDASAIELTCYTANGGGITLSNGATLTLGNLGNNSYGALLGNGAGGINVTSGTAYVNLYQDITATDKVASFASLRDGNYKITVASGATLEWLGGIQAHDLSPGTLDANIVVNGAGLLILKEGVIGGRYYSSTTAAGQLDVTNGGTVRLTDGASVYDGATVNLAVAGSTLDVNTTSGLVNNRIIGLGTVNLNAASSVSGTLSLDAGITLDVNTASGLVNNSIIGSGIVNLNAASSVSGTLSLDAGITLNAKVAESLQGVGKITGSGTLDAAVKNIATSTPLDITGVTLKISAQDALQSVGKITLTNGKITGTQYTTISNGLELNGSSVANTANYGAYGSFLFVQPLTVTGGTATTPSTSSMNVEGARFRGQATSTIDVAEHTTLNYSGDVTYDNSGGNKTELRKTGKGTWNITSGTVGGFYVDARGTTASAGIVNVQEGTLALNGAKFYSGSEVQVTPETGNTATLQIGSGQVGSKVAYKITGTAGLTTPNAVLSVTANDGLYQNFGTLELTNALLTASAYTTLDSLITLKNGQIISTVVNPHTNYGSFLINGENLSEGQCVINATEGTSLIQAGGHGIRLRTNGGTSSLAVAKRSTTLNVAEGATLNVAASLTYDCTLTDTTANDSHGIYKSGGGLWNQTTGTVGGFCTNSSGTADAAGKVFVEDGTLRMSGDSTFYTNSTIYVRSGGTLDLNTSATPSVSYHLAGDGDDGVGALRFSNNRTVSDTITLDAAASIGVAEDVTATVSSVLQGGQALTKVGAGTLALNGATNLITALNVLDGTVKLNAFGTLRGNTESILVSGSDSVLDLAVNDALYYGSGTGGAAGADGIVIENGGTLTNTTETTTANAGSNYSTLTYGFTLNNGTVTAVGEGCTDRGNENHGLADGYGNYLLTGKVSVIGTGVSTIDAYRIRMRGNGNFEILPTAVLETSTKFDTDQGIGMKVSGGGTLRPTSTTFTTPGLAIQDSTLDLTALDTPTTTGTDWQLLSTTGGNASLATIDIAQSMNGSSASSGLFSMDSGSRLAIDLQMTEDGILGQTILADDFTIDNALLELNLLGDWTLDAVGTYTLFSDALSDVVFAGLSVLGNAGELRFSLDGNVLTVGVPEPASWVLMLLLFWGYLGFRRRGETR
ncbi:MAG: PEP-CTERM sorting domain-containing protein [Planctomycetia bacterium]|nr:PEP-CTERM sorting domain-containing protein [Planctomycetia bacterium]